MKKIYRVPDMHCNNCVMRLEGLEDTLPGVRRVQASYHRQELIVEFDAAQVSEAEIIAAAQKLGYHLKAV
jgi:copper chaperone CopZ